MELPKRKTTRLANYDYSNDGAYFITICTLNRKCLLSKIVGTDVLDGPQVTLSSYGEIANKHITAMNSFYKNISVDNYVIMPNHIHLLIQVISSNTEGGPPRTSVPTKRSIVARFISTFKRFCNKEYGENIWQYRSFDHIIRNKQDYEEINKYISLNPEKWIYDRFYCE